MAFVAIAAVVFVVVFAVVVAVVGAFEMNALSSVLRIRPFLGKFSCFYRLVGGKRLVLMFKKYLLYFGIIFWQNYIMSSIIAYTRTVLNGR